MALTLDQYIEIIVSPKLFVSVGNIIPNENIVQLFSLEKAIEITSDNLWADIGLDIANLIRQQVSNKLPQRLQEWNGIVNSIRQLIVDFVNRQSINITELYPELEMSWIISRCKWHIVHGCMEVAYDGFHECHFLPRHHKLLSPWSCAMWVGW